MKKLFFFLTLLPFLSCQKDGSYEEKAEEVEIMSLSDEMAAVRDYVPLYACIAHRGTTYWAPEATEASWRWARNMGVDYLEGDLQCSKDGVVIVLHDVDFSRTTDVQTLLSNFSTLRHAFYKSFKNPDGSCHFTDEDIEEQVAADIENGVESYARCWYFAEMLMMDAGSWFNVDTPDRARDAFVSDGMSVEMTIATGEIVFCNGQSVNSLHDMVAYASGKKLLRDENGRRCLSYRIKPEYADMTLRQIRSRSDAERGTTVAGVHYCADPKYMDFVEYDFSSSYEDDEADNGNRPGIYIEFKESTYQPLDLEARTYNVLDQLGWNVITMPTSVSPFYTDGHVNVGNTMGKVVLQSFRLEAVERVEQVFCGKVPMCYLIDDVPPTDWDPDHYFDTPEDAAAVIDNAIMHGCHIIGPSIDGEPNNYPNRCQDWQLTLIRRAAMLCHVWSIDNMEQMLPTVNGHFTNRSEMTLQWLIDSGLRCSAEVYNPFHPDVPYDNSKAPCNVADAEEMLSVLGY